MMGIENGLKKLFQKEEHISFEDLPLMDCQEVVRCRDCKYGTEEEGCIDCSLDPRADVAQWQQDDYCSYGERRKD